MVVMQVRLLSMVIMIRVIGIGILARTLAVFLSVWRSNPALLQGENGDPTQFGSLGEELGNKQR
jgi:hypothetical protein